MATRRGVWVLLAIVLVGAALAVAVLANGGLLSGSGTGSPVIIPAGYAVQLKSGTYVSFQGTFANPVHVTGSFTTSYTISFYVMNPGQFNSFTSGAGGLQFVAAYNADSGQASPTSVSVDLPQGQYYFVIVNPYPFSSSFETTNGVSAS